jgi:hypothetical protein
MATPPGSPISYFSTTWIVPGTDALQNNNQNLAIFNGLEDLIGDGDIIQPVMQWGQSAIGGGAYWSIGSEFVSASTDFAVYTPAIQIPESEYGLQSLTGVIEMPTANGLDESGNSYQYTCYFAQYTSQTTLTVYEGNLENEKIGAPKPFTYTPSLPVLNQAYETLEGYNIGSGSIPSIALDYPAQDYIKMTNINISLLNGTSPSPVTWGTANTTEAQPAGQQTIIVNGSNPADEISNPGGEVDIYFHGAIPPAISYSPSNVTYTEGTQISNLTPANGGGIATSYSITPALPTDLTLNPTTGVISGTPTSLTTLTTYTITATNAGGSNSTTVTITVNAPPTQIAYDFEVTTESYSSSYFTLAANGVDVSGGETETASENVVKNIDYNVYTNANSTVVLTINSGYMPISATLGTYLTGVSGVISGRTITFSGVNINAKQPSLSIVLH